MQSKGVLIVRDILYMILVIVLLLPGNPLGMSSLVRILFVIFAIGSSVWRHIVYYKATGKIY